MKSSPGLLLEALGETGVPRTVVLAVIQRELESRAGAEGSGADVLSSCRGVLEALRGSRFADGINATGIAFPAVSSGQTRKRIGNSRNDKTGERAALRRRETADKELAMFLGAGGAVVVHSEWLALFLVLRRCVTSKRREIVIHPKGWAGPGLQRVLADVAKAAGAKLRLIGGSGKASIRDYIQSIGSRTALVLHSGDLLESPAMGDGMPAMEDLARIARRSQVPLVALFPRLVQSAGAPPSAHGSAAMISDAFRRGADGVIASSARCAEGPPAGILAGRSSLIARIRKDPLCGVFRCDPDQAGRLPALLIPRMEEIEGKPPAAGRPGAAIESLRLRAEKLKLALEALPMKTSVQESRSVIAGKPGAGAPSVCLALVPLTVSIEALAKVLRTGKPAVIGSVAAGRLFLDLSTVPPSKDEDLFRAVFRAFGV